MVFFATLILIYHRMGESTDIPPFDDARRELLRSKWNPRLRVELFIGGLALYGQILVGAFVRHSGAGSACGFGPESLLLCRDIPHWKLFWWPLSSSAQLHMIHRYLGVCLALYLAAWALRALFFLGREGGKMIFPILLLFGAILLQVFLGVSMVQTALGIVPTTAHLGIAALSLGLVWFLYLRLGYWEESLFGEKCRTLASDLFELTRPKLNALVVVTVFVGMVLASATSTEAVLFKGLLAAVLILSVAMGATTLNSYLERETDKLMERTRTRPLPGERISPRTALIQGILLLLAPLPLLALKINLLTAILALFAALLYLFVYTPLKQKSSLALYLGAVSGALPPLLGWTSVTNSIDPMAWSLFAVLVAWQLPHFLAISIYHAEDYRTANIKIYPTLWGVEATEKLIFLFTGILLLCSLFPYWWGGASLAYRNAAIALGIVCLFLSGRSFCSDRGQSRVRARDYFWASIFYLPLLLGAMIFLT